MLTVDVSPSDGGIVEVNLNTPASFPANFSIPSGESVRLKAVPNTDYEFVSWNGSLSSTANPDAFIMDCNKRITANFNKIPTPTIDTDGSSSTGPSTDNYSFSEGSEVTVTVNPDNGWPSESWIGDVTEPESSPDTDSNKTVSTSFEQIKLNWWLIYGIIAGAVIIVIAVLLAFRHRTVPNK